MIRYALACDQAHEFESWFASSQAYEALHEQRLVTCPECGSSQVSKQLMAPRIARGRGDEARPASPAETPAPAAPVPRPVALLTERERALRAMLKAVREHVTRTADYVGPGFADEARRMQSGEVEHRPIYGEASPGEVRSLVEDGIEVMPLPVLPDERN